MTNAVRFLRPFHRVVQDVDTQIARLIDERIIVRQLMPRHEAVRTGRLSSVFLSQYAFQMHSQLVLSVVLRADVIKLPLGPNRVRFMSTGYACKIPHLHLVTRYDSGHYDHKSYPHVTDEWMKHTGAAGPDIPAEKGLSIGQFVRAVEVWRIGNRAVLPVGLGSLKSIRWQSLTERSLAD
jgi:hypothetical protein